MSEFSCSICNYTSSVKKCVQKHINKKIKCGDGIPVILTIPVEIKCDACNKKFSTKDTLSYHILNTCRAIDCISNNEIIENLKKENEKLCSENELLKIKLSEKQKPNYKSKLNSVLRFAVWNSVIGNKIAVHKCVCCNSNEISQQNFQCGHIISRNNGGEDIIDNLVPICGNCNSSMGSTDMDSFIKTLTVSN